MSISLCNNSNNNNRYQGRVVAIPLPSRFTSGTNQLVRPAIHQLIDPSILISNECTSPLRYTPQSTFDQQHQEIFLPKEKYEEDPSLRKSSCEDSSDCSVIRLEIYLYNDTSPDAQSLLLELNRDSKELMTNTLQRISLSLIKKIRQRELKQKKIKNRKNVGKPIARIMRPIDNDNNNNNVDFEEVDISDKSNLKVWEEARKMNFVIELESPELSLENNDNAEKSILRLLVESCPPTIAAVHTFEEFKAYNFPRVPVVLRVDTIYATGSLVDWYVNGQLRETTVSHIGYHSFTPSTEDIGKEMAVLVKPFRDNLDELHNGIGCQQAYRYDRSVEPLPDNTVVNLRSGWLQEGDTTTNVPNSPFLIRFLSYNILANQNAFQSDTIPFYPYVSKEIISKERRLPLILHEILSYDADIICLQEVDEAVYKTLLEPVLTSPQFNYEGYYSGKDSDGTREGCATFWSIKKFQHVTIDNRRTFSIPNLLDDNNELSDWSVATSTLRTLLNCRNDLKHIFLTKLGHIFQFVPLRLIDDTTSSKNSIIWVSNTHLFFHPLGSHIRLMQVYFLARRLAFELHKQPGEVIVCGDFNSSLENVVGKLLLDRIVRSNFRDTKVHLNSFQWDDKDPTGTEETFDNDFPELSLPDSFPILHSAVLPTPEFTHYIDGFVGNLDHILLSKNMKCIRSAPMPTKDEVSVATAMPSANLPSDHVSLLCDIAVNSP